MLSKLLAACAAIALLVPAAHAQAKGTPFNRVVVMIDASGSYRDRQADAVAKVNAMLAGLAERRPKRWATPDDIVIISLDASPEVIWRGTPRKLIATDRSEWVARFNGRADYAACTDVARGLNLAAHELNVDPAPAARYLFAFSDLTAEPPTKGVSACAAPTPVPDKEVDWEALKPVSVAAFWLPADQKMAWDAAMRAHGLTTYRLFSVSESTVNRIDLPEPAKRAAPTEAEKQQSRATLWGWICTIGGLTLLLALVVPLIAGVVPYGRRRRFRASAPTPAGRPGVAVRGPVAPLRIPPAS